MGTRNAWWGRWRKPPRPRVGREADRWNFAACEEVIGVTPTGASFPGRTGGPSARGRRQDTAFHLPPSHLWTHDYHSQNPPCQQQASSILGPRASSPGLRRAPVRKRPPLQVIGISTASRRDGARKDPNRSHKNRQGRGSRCQLSLNRIQALTKVREATDYESRFRYVSSAGGGRLFGKSGPNPFVGASVEDHPAGGPHPRDPEGGAAILAVIGRSAQSSGRRGPGEQWRE